MNLEELAQTTLRLGRKRGLVFRVERWKTSATPTLHVSPKHLVTVWLRQAITRSKTEIITLLETEGQGECTAADGTVWRQTLARCELCGSSDWGVIGQETNTQGAQRNLWGCLTCHTPVATLQQALEDAALDQRWPQQEAR